MDSIKIAVFTSSLRASFLTYIGIKYVTVKTTRVEHPRIDKSVPAGLGTKVGSLYKTYTYISKKLLALP